MRQQTISLFVLSCLTLACHSVYAAKAIDLSKRDSTVLNSLLVSQKQGALPAAQSHLLETQRSTDLNQATHIRMQQTYAGYPVYGADAIVHLPKSLPAHAALVTLNLKSAMNVTMDGVVYDAIANDLQDTPSHVFTEQQAGKAAKAIAIQTNTAAKVLSSKLMVYVDPAQKAHWVYRIAYAAATHNKKKMPSLPVYLVDAVTFHIYKQWDEIKTAHPKLESVKGGGLGGNKKMGQLIFDGLTGHLGNFDIKRDATSATCFLQNDEITIKRYDKASSNDGEDIGRDFAFSCKEPNSQHARLYWNESDPANGAFSPADDALFQGQVVKNMYRQWYKQEILSDAKGNPKRLKMIVHKPMANAYWDPYAEQMVFGDGQEEGYGDLFYPLTSLGVTAHEMSHVFTEMHSNLAYQGHSGGLNESFSDMAAKAAEYYVNGKDLHWQIGPEVFKQDGALRYMDHPSQDCGRKDVKGVSCSIENVRDFKDGSNGYEETDVHFSSGVYNRVFYLLATAPGWNTRKAFDVMVEANMHYWTSNVDFHQAGCGVIKALKSYDETTHGDFTTDLAILNRTYQDVGINTSQCRF